MTRPTGKLLNLDVHRTGNLEILEQRTLPDGPKVLGHHDAGNSPLACPTRSFLHICSGRKRPKDLGHYLLLLATEIESRLPVGFLDVQVDSKKSAVRFWTSEVRSGRVAGAHAAPPCSTWSRVRVRPGGPPPVRSQRQPWGLEDLSRHEQDAVELANDLLLAALTIETAIVRAGGFATLEHPEDPGEGYPSIWRLPEVLDFLAECARAEGQDPQGSAALCVAAFDQCPCGAPSVKGTMIGVLLPALLHHLRGQRQHWSRSSRAWDQRCVVFTDSLVGRGARGNCRSSSPPLLRLGRRFAAIRGAGNIRIAPRWVPLG